MRERERERERGPWRVTSVGRSPPPNTRRAPPRNGQPAAASSRSSTVRGVGDLSPACHFHRLSAEEEDIYLSPAFAHFENVFFNQFSFILTYCYTHFHTCLTACSQIRMACIYADSPQLLHRCGAGCAQMPNGGVSHISHRCGADPGRFPRNRNLRSSPWIPTKAPPRRVLLPLAGEIGRPDPHSVEELFCPDTSSVEEPARQPLRR